MTTPTHYGTLESEKRAEENRIARTIVQEIGHFGISERQRWLVMYLLAMELENIEDLRAITGFIKERKGDSVFLTGKDTEDGPLNS